MPKISGHELDNKEITKKSAEMVWVPARNVVFLSIGAALAENFKYDTIVTGFDIEEAATFPDNTIEFVERFNEMLKFGTLNKTSVYAPLIFLNKSDIVKRGLEIERLLNGHGHVTMDQKNLAEYANHVSGENVLLKFPAQKTLYLKD